MGKKRVGGVDGGGVKEMVVNGGLLGFMGEGGYEVVGDGSVGGGGMLVCGLERKGVGGELEVGV